MNGSHSGYERAKGQAEPNQKWRVEEADPQTAEAVEGEPERLRGAERHPEPTEAVELSLTAPTPEPYNPDQRDDQHWREPQESRWEHPEPGTYGFRQQLHQVEVHQRQALDGADWTTGLIEQ